MEMAAGHPLNRLLFWRKKEPAVMFEMHLGTFRRILERNIRVLELMADMGEKLSGEYIFDRQYILSVVEELNLLLKRHIADLGSLDGKNSGALVKAFDRVNERIREETAGERPLISDIPFIRRTDEIMTARNHAREELGTENIMMGEIRHRLALRSPEGFFLTTRAFTEYMEHNGLTPHGKAYFDRLEKGHWKAADKALKDLRSLILGGEVPRKVAEGILAEADRLCRKSGTDRISFSVRGCEWSGEKETALDIPFRTFLNVPRKKMVNVYKDVVADFLCSSRLHHYPYDNFSISAGYFAMVDSKSSGFLRTFDPDCPENETMAVGAFLGLGGALKDVEGDFDRYGVSREAPHHILSRDVVRKDRMLTLRGDDGTLWMNIPHYTCRAPSVRDDQLTRLAETAILIERYVKRPLEITWCFDREENLFVLRISPLSVRIPAKEKVSPVETAIRNAKVLFSGKGMVVQSGIATGRVFVVRNEEDLDHFPAGAILVSDRTSPRYLRIIRKVNGILTSVGSPTGHMAAMAREFRVPAIVNCGEVLKGLKTGDEITIDAAYNVIYAGAVKELQRFELMEEDLFEESSEYLMLRRLIDHIGALNLIDPHSANFSPGGCRTYHDIMRYVHEMAIRKLIDLSAGYKHRGHVPVSRLEMDIPLGIFIAEIDEKTSPGHRTRIRECDVDSIPMQALLAGLRESGMWSTKPLSVDMGSFMSSLTRTFSYSLAMPEQVGMNLALISEEYMNLNLRLGYHYTIVDALISDRTEENRISFRFFGGVTDFSRRSMRVKFIHMILEKFDFRVESHGDLVVGRFKKAPRSRMVGKMKMIGGLIGYTRQLDVQMNSEERLVCCVNDFMDKIKSTMEVEDERHDP